MRCGVVEMIDANPRTEADQIAVYVCANIATDPSMKPDHSKN
jgi:hypothetical protein